MGNQKKSTVPKGLAAWLATLSSLDDLGPPNLREERLEWQARLRRETSPDIAKQIDMAIRVAAYLVPLSDKEDRRTKDAQRKYWSTRRKIEAQLEDLRRHPYVRDLPSATFYSPHTVMCAHGRSRKQCIKIHDLLTLRDRLGPRGLAELRRR
jgi:hypothetical protein